MFVTIINDSRDDNALGRLRTRAVALLEAPVTSVGVTSDLEGAGNLVDVLDASQGAFGVVMMNIAPRNHEAKKKWPNGTPFGYFYYENTLVLSTIDGLALSLVKKLDVIKELHVFDIPTVLRYAVEQGLLEKSQLKHISENQFRSYEFLPRAAQWLMHQHELPAKPMLLRGVKKAPAAVWYVDIFGNCKTTILPEEIRFRAGKTKLLKKQKVKCYNRLKDVDDLKPGITVGSSGIGDRRFVEIAVQGGSAADLLDLKSGSRINL
ncbi:SAM hydroxide adenosyltransferase [Patescibacteria group bacterium]